MEVGDLYEYTHVSSDISKGSIFRIVEVTGRSVCMSKLVKGWVKPGMSETIYIHKSRLRKLETRKEYREFFVDTHSNSYHYRDNRGILDFMTNLLEDCGKVVNSHYSRRFWVLKDNTLTFTDDRPEGMDQLIPELESVVTGYRLISPDTEELKEDIRVLESKLKEARAKLEENTKIYEVV